MGALGDFFQGAYAYSEQERIRQVEEDNKFKLYEKQQRLVNSLADEDRKSQVARTQEMPELGKIFFFNADGQKIGETDMDKIAQQTARSAGAKAETDQAQSALGLFLDEQYGAGQRAASIDATRAQAEATRKYGDAAGKRADEDDTPQLTPGQKDAIGKEAYELESGLRKALDPYESMLQEQLRSENEAERKAAPDKLGAIKEVQDVLRKALTINDPVKRRDLMREVTTRARQLGVPLE